MPGRVATHNTLFREKDTGSRMHLDKSITIRASPTEVYRWLAPHRQAAWDPALVRATEPAPEGRFEHVASGSSRKDGPGDRRFVRVHRAFGHRFESHAVATRMDEAQAFAWEQLEGDFEEHRGMFLLEPTADGTRVHLVADVEFPYVMPRVVTEAEVRRAVSDEVDEALLRLKALVERGRVAG